jgi:hypothetical protein
MRETFQRLAEWLKGGTDKFLNYFSGIIAVIITILSFSGQDILSERKDLKEQLQSTRYEQLKYRTEISEHRMRILENKWPLFQDSVLLKAAEKDIEKSAIPILIYKNHELRDSIRLLNQRFRNIERIIIQDPSKSLEIPFMKRDIEDVDKQTKILY